MSEWQALEAFAHRIPCPGTRPVVGEVPAVKQAQCAIARAAAEFLEHGADCCADGPISTRDAMLAKQQSGNTQRGRDGVADAVAKIVRKAQEPRPQGEVT